MSLDSGTVVGRYRVSRLIAQGGMAEVYRAEQELTAGIYRPAALKVIRPEYSESADFREMFLDEARTACTLSHPNIVHIYEVGEADGRLYMAMELVPGESVAAVIRRLGENNDRFSDEALLSIGIAVCSALEMVHALTLAGSGYVNLVHRDVSPHNLLLGPNGSLKLIDFGIAKAATNRNLTMPGVTKGKAGYFSPEQAMGKTLDGRSDLFSLGVTLYKLASGVTPFEQHKTHQARNTALVHGEWEPLIKVRPGLPAGFYEVIDRALALKRDDRWPDAREMREALENVAIDAGLRVGPSMMAGYAQAADDDEVSVTGTPVRATTTARRPAVSASTTARQITDKVSRPQSRRQQWAWGAVAAVAAISIVGLLAFGSRRPSVHPTQRPVATVARPAPTPPPPAPAAAPTIEPLEAPEHTKTAAAIAPSDTAVKMGAPVLAQPEKKKMVRRASAKRVAAAPTTESATAPAPIAEPDPEPGGSGKLRINSAPYGGWVIGSLTGQTPDNVELPSGSYTVQLQKTSGEKRNCSVKVYPDKTTFLNFNFDVGRCETSHR